MTADIKILLIIVAVQCFQANGNPFFQGLSFQRGFEINFKPLPRKPIAFIREKWSPLGVFGKKFAIEKRSIDDMVPRAPVRVPRPAAPVFEHIDEIEHIGTAPLLIIPKPPLHIPIPPPKPIPVPAEPPKPPAEKPPPPLPVPMPIIVNELPPLPPKSHEMPPISTNMVIIQPTKVVNSHISPGGLYTDISRVESVKEHVHYVKPPPPAPPKPPVPVPVVPPADIKPPVPIPPPVVAVPPPPVAPPPPVVSPPPVAPPPLVPPPPAVPHTPPHPIPIKEEEKVEPPPPIPAEVPKTEIFLKESTLIKGSKMALQFGTVFLTLMAQFFDNARASIDLMTNPPPKFKP